MKRSIIGAIVGAATVAAVLAIGPGGVASAHHPVVTGETQCQTDGTYKITWTATSWEQNNLSWRLTVPVALGPQPNNTPFTWNQTVPGTTRSKTISVTARWSNGNSGTRDGSVRMDGQCKPGKPADKVTYTEWVDGVWVCGDTTVEQTRTKTTTPYVWDSETRKWVEDTANATSKTETQTRDLTEQEQYTCQNKAIPVAPTVVAPTCFAAGRVVLPESTPGYEWVLQEDGTYLAVADKDYYFDDDANTTFDPGDLSQLTGEQCQTQPPVPPQPPQPPFTPQGVLPVAPTVTPPDCDAPGTVVLPDPTVGYDWVKQPDGTTWKAVIEPGYAFDPFAVTTFESGDLSQKTGDECDDVESKPPVVAPPTVAPPAVLPPVVAPPAQVPAAGTPTQLPSTGSSSWALALIALVTLLGGTGLVRLSRRPTD